MKCVLEIIEMTKCAEIAYQEEEKRLDLIAQEERAERIKKTIEFCETTINDDFVRQALNRISNPSFRMSCVIGEDRLKNKIIYPLERTAAQYADNKTSYAPNTAIAYDYDALTEYLAQFCYKVSKVEETYYRYGCGRCKGNEIIVTFA